MNTALLAAVGGVVGAGCAAEGPGVRLERAAGSPVRVGAPAGRPAAGDVNGDGLVDLVAPCGLGKGREGARLVVLINRGGGRMEKGAEVGAWKDVPNVLLGDVDGDGKLDAVAAEHDSYAVTVMLGDGRGGFAAAPGSPFMAAAGGHAHTHGLALTDINRDRRLDVLTTNADDRTVSVLLGDGRGGFAGAAGSPFAVVAGAEPYDAIGVADFSGDGLMDVAVPLLVGDAVAVMLGDGRGGLGPARAVRVGARPAFLEVADVNGDGKADLVVTHDDVGMVDVLLGDGRGGFNAAAGSPLRLSKPVWEVGVGDLNGDGRLDLALGENEDRAVVIAVGDGRGGFRAAERVELGGAPGNVIVVDMDRDGRLDVVCAGYESGEVTVLLAK